MPLSVMSSLMLIVAHASGFICDRDRVKRAYALYACLFLVGILILRRFEIDVSIELLLSAASILFVCTAAASYAFWHQSAAQTVLLIVISIALSLLFHFIRDLLEHDAGLLACGLLAVLANIAFNGRGRSLLLICALSPLFYEAENTLILYLNTGYCCFELSNDALDMMLICALFTGFTHGILNWSTHKSSTKDFSILRSE
ncbi:MAG: hypothetical protein IKZ82_00385 [Clostridia bacterium]|nr:hypothetical protein [Clostridia bacterium]